MIIHASRFLRGLIAALLLLLALGGLHPAQAVVVISEIMYHPSGGGRDLEYVELFNESPDPIDLTGYFLCRGVSFTFTNRTFLDPGAYIVVCANATAIKQAYSITNAVGDWSAASSLDNGGERIDLCNPAGVVEASVRYNDRGKWPSGADGTGHSLELVYAYSELDDPDHWALSGARGGSPGKPNDTLAGSIPVYINEARCVTDSGDRWVELFNAGDAELDLSGYHLSTDRDGQVRATLPPATVVPGRGWISFTDAQLGLDFRPNGEGQTWIELLNPARDRVVDARIFEPKISSLSEARIPDGSAEFSEAADPTRDAANKITVATDIVINEILYHAVDDDPRGEFLELYNRGAQPVSLAGWRFTDGVDFEFPSGTTILPDSYLVVAAYPDHIKEVYGLQTVLGPLDEESLDRFGGLADRGERVTLSDAVGNTVDTVRYRDGGEWPVWADGGGSSLELVDPFQDSEVGQAWDSSEEAAKSQAREYEYRGTFTGGEPEFHLVLTGAGIVLVDDIKVVTEVTDIEAIRTFVDFTGTVRYFKGTAAPSDPADAWMQVDFDDAGWLSGPMPIGFGERDEGTLLEDMLGNYSSFFVRAEFDVADPAAEGSLILDLEFDDGCIAYLNGVEVAGGNMRPGQTGYDALAASSKEKLKIQEDLGDKKSLLRAGKNVLAVQVHNASLTSSDARLKARLLLGRFVTAEGPNLVKDGTFETDAYKTSWWIQGTHGRSGRTTVEPLSGQGSLKIVATASGDNKVNRIETSNTGFLTPVVRTEYRISFLARWIAGSPVLLTHGAYAGSMSPSFAASHRLDLPPRPGTPGARNSVTARRIAEAGSSNTGPMISKVSHDPAIPAASAPVVVRARVEDPDGVASAVVRYSLDTPRAPDDPLLLSVPMTGPDPEGYYRAELPGQALRKRVVFYISATDSKGVAGRYPLDETVRTAPLFLDPAAVTQNDYLYCVYRPDAPYRGKQHSYRVWLHQANELYLNSRPLLSNDPVDGSFYFNNVDIYYNSKIRFSGSPFARQAWTESYRVRLPKDHPLHGSIEAFNMEDHQGAGARDGHERISHYLLRWNQGGTRMPYSLQWLVQYQVNDRVNEVREHVQTPNREFVSRWWPDEDDGDFFEMDDRHVINDAGGRQESIDGRVLYPPYGSATNGSNKEEYRYYFNLRQKEELDDFTTLIDLAKIMTQTVTPNTEYDELIWDTVDVEAFCRNWSIRLNTDDWDTWGARRGKNCYLYRPSGSGLWVDIPWDMELTYSDVNSFMPPTLNASNSNSAAYPSAFAEVTRFINRPRIKRMYYGIMKEMVDSFFQSSFLTPWMLKLDSIGVVNTQVGKAGGFIDQRRTRLIAAVRGVTSPTIDFVVTTNGGASFETESAQVTIEGKAPVEIAVIGVTVNGSEGIPADVRFSDTNVLGWSATMVLPLGKSTVGLQGWNSVDDPVDSTSIDITVIPPAKPEIQSVDPDRLVIGESAVITGTGFRPGLAVYFGTVQAVTVTFDPAVDPARIVAVVPEGLPVGPSSVSVANLSGQESAPYPIEIVAAKKRFIRGDVDLNEQVNITDAILTLEYLFKGGLQPTCLDAADTNDDSAVNLTDPVVSLQHLFQGGPPPAAPYPTVGEDPAAPEDPLDCAIGLE